MTFKIRLTHFKKLERSLLPLKKSMLTMKYKLLYQVSLENLCKGKGIKFINNNNNIDGSCLNRSKLHLNKSGTAQLLKKLSQALKPN